MNQDELLRQIADLNNKLNKSQRQLAGLRERSKLLDRQYDDARAREHNSNELAMQLLERQKELNVMLNRSNIMLNRTQETMALASMEFNEMAKALPEPERKQMTDRISRINDLFRKTGYADAALPDPGKSTSNPASDVAEISTESSEWNLTDDSIWENNTKPKPPTVEAIPVEDHASAVTYAEPDIAESATEPAAIHCEDDEDRESSESQTLVFPPRRKSWWPVLKSL